MLWRRYHLRSLGAGIMLLFLGSLLACSEDTIELEGVGSIKGRIVEKGSNEPLENVKVSTNPSSSTVFTDEKGFYKIENVAIGEYSLSTQREGLLTKFTPVSVVKDKAVEVVVEMEEETAGNRPPEAAMLVSPKDNTTAAPVEVTLTWIGKDPDADELTYTVTLKNDENSSVEVFENISDTTYVLSGLGYGIKYFWQVTSSDDINDPVYSETFSFETGVAPDNRILYTRLVNGNSVIYSADENGENEVRLTALDKNSFRPRRSAHTGSIAFLQSVGGKIQLFTMKEDGSDTRQVTTTVPVSGFNLEEVDFSWSSRGATLLFPSQDKLYRIKTDGSGVQQLYKTGDGKLITEIDYNDTTHMAVVKVNDVNGYEVAIFTLNASWAVKDTILTGMPGAAGSINLSVDGTKVLYSRDVSGFEHVTYRQLDSKLFVHTIADGTAVELSTGKPAGTNDLDARFSPNEAAVIFVNTSNDGRSVKNIQTVEIGDISNRKTLIEGAAMADWE
ncbi:carboxypeptidase regulatory-like domain-containing protein [Aquimarina hainanensis]|uniref:Carboxypeptidase regulatory-like domain-containing protein n=2 Tax=Aquimarina hainanensis TaxID=1578017 RepID=A0ABW5N911_9FLAO